MIASKLYGTTALLGALAAAMPARAQDVLPALPPLPNTQLLGTLLFNLGPQREVLTFGPTSQTNPAWGTVALDMEGQPQPSVTANAQMSNSNFGPLYGRAVGLMGYFFAVDGPGTHAWVDIDVAGSVTASATAGASFVVTSRWELWNEAGQVTLLATDEIGTPQMTGSTSQSFSHVVTRNLEIGHVYFVRMLANAEAAATNPGSSASASAFIDPVFRIGGGLDPSLYSFGFSNGIGNQPVPEPPALALLTIGLLALGWRQLASRNARRASPSVS